MAKVSFLLYIFLSPGFIPLYNKNLKKKLIYREWKQTSTTKTYPLFHLNLLTKSILFNSEMERSLFSLFLEYSFKKIMHVSCTERGLGNFRGGDQNGAFYLKSQNCLKWILICLEAKKICTQVLHFIGYGHQVRFFFTLYSYFSLKTICLFSFMICFHNYCHINK